MAATDQRLEQLLDWIGARWYRVYIALALLLFVTFHVIDALLPQPPAPPLPPSNIIIEVTP